MKLYAVLAAAALLLTVPMTVYADDEGGAFVGESIRYDYSIEEDGSVKLKSFKDAETFEGPLVIPEEIEGHPVTDIENGCFMSAKGITSVTIPSSLSDIGISVFFDCDALEHFEVADGNTWFTVNDGVLFEDSGKVLVAYPASKEGESYTVPDGVDEILSGAFGFAQNLKSVTIPDGVTYIGSWAFGHCDTLESAEIAGSVYTIANYAFSYCSNLKELHLNSGTAEISHAAFAYDTSLAQVTLPDTLSTVGQYAFCGTAMSCVTIPPMVESISYCAFGYDGDMKAIHDFVVYGQPGTEAQLYATASDQENDYQNNFTFIAVEDANIPYELGGGKLYEEDAETDETAAAEENSNAAAETETDEDGKPASVDNKIGAGLSGNKRLQLILGIGGGAAVILAVILLIAYMRKPKIRKDDEQPETAPETSEETPQEEAQEESQDEPQEEETKDDGKDGDA